MRHDAYSKNLIQETMIPICLPISSERDFGRYLLYLKHKCLILKDYQYGLSKLHQLFFTYIAKFPYNYLIKHSVLSADNENSLVDRDSAITSEYTRPGLTQLSNFNVLRYKEKVSELRDIPDSYVTIQKFTSNSHNQCLHNYKRIDLAYFDNYIHTLMIYVKRHYLTIHLGMIKQYIKEQHLYDHLTLFDIHDFIKHEIEASDYYKINQRSLL